MRLGFYLRRPTAVLNRVWRAWHDRRHPGAPWLSPVALRILDERLDRSMTGLEWGSGKSTVWFAQRLAYLTSVEHDPAWHARVTGLLREAGVTNVEQRLAPAPPRGVTEQQYWAPSPYVLVADDFAPGSLGVVLVDGLYRQNCVARVLGKISPGGYLVIDNSRAVPRLQDWGVPEDWELVHHSRRRFQDTTIWRRPPV